MSMLAYAGMARTATGCSARRMISDRVMPEEVEQ